MAARRLVAILVLLLEAPVLLALLAGTAITGGIYLACVTWRRVSGTVRSVPAASDPSDPTPPVVNTSQLDAEALVCRVEELKGFAEFEQKRGESFRQRSSWVLALSGAILTLVANQAREMLKAPGALGDAGIWIASVSLALGALLIVIGAGVALSVAVTSGTTFQPTVQEILKRVTPEGFETSTKQILVTQSINLATTVERLRPQGDALARRLRLALVALFLGLACIAVHIGVYAERSVECAVELDDGPPARTSGASPLGRAVASVRVIAQDAGTVIIRGDCGEDVRSAVPELSASRRAEAQTGRGSLTQ